MMLKANVQGGVADTGGMGGHLATPCRETVERRADLWRERNRRKHEGRYVWPEIQRERQQHQLRKEQIRRFRVDLVSDCHRSEEDRTE